MNTRGARPRGHLVAPMMAAVTALALAGCSDDSGSNEGGSSEFDYLSFAENTSIQDTLKSLSSGACAEADEAAPLKVTTQPQATFDQQIQLQAGQGALPSLFASGNAPSVSQQMHEAGQLVEVGDELEALGKGDAIIPAAKSTIDAIYGGEQYVLPTEFNIEGIWFNKSLLADNGIEQPESWDDLVAASEKLADAGVTPMAAAGKDGWPITRLVGSYLFRSLGPDALEKVVDGEAELTDPEYVEAAEEIADLGESGAFGPSVGSIDYTTALNQFLTGKAAMYYMGSWVLANFNNPEENQIGADNIGFMAFPDVEGGAGSSAQLAANVGSPLAMSQQKFDNGAKDWLGCIADNFGTQSLEDQGVITGFKVTQEVADLPALTQLVQEKVEATSETVLWFEALFNPEATLTSQNNAQLLVTGKMSPEDFMAAVQGDIG